MRWLLAAIVCIVILAAPKRPDNFTMRFVDPGAGRPAYIYG
jgi:hypothetical protein